MLILFNFVPGLFCRDIMDNLSTFHPDTVPAPFLDAIYIVLRLVSDWVLIKKIKAHPSKKINRGRVLLLIGQKWHGYGICALKIINFVNLTNISTVD